MSLEDKKQSADFWFNGGQSEEYGFLLEDVKAAVEKLKSNFRGWECEECYTKYDLLERERIVSIIDEVFGKGLSENEETMNSQQVKSQESIKNPLKSPSAGEINAVDSGTSADALLSDKEEMVKQ